MSVITIKDRTTQLVPASTFSNRTVLRFVDEDDPTPRTKFAMPHNGRTLVLCWASGNWPEDPSRKALRDALPAIPSATAMGTAAGRTALNAWAKAIDKAVRALLVFDPPTWQFVITRYPPGADPDWTERAPVGGRPGTDWSGLYVAEFDSDPDVPFSIDAYHDGKAAVPIDSKNLHIVPLATGVTYQ